MAEKGDLISRSALIAEYDRVHIGPPGGARKLMEDAPGLEVLVLPCKIGEKVFCVLHAKNEIVEDVVEDYDIWSIKKGIKLRISLLNHKDYVVGEFGKTVFLTREEAEAAIAERSKKC